VPPGDTIPKDVPVIPGTPQQTPLPFMPQFDPTGSVTGQMAPPGPGSSTQGWNPTPQPTDMVPPMTGPNSDRFAGNTASTDPGQAWRNAVTMANPAPLPEGQSAASALFGGMGGGAPGASGLTPSVSNAGATYNGMPVSDAPMAAPPSGPGLGQPGAPMAGPGADRNLPPPGLLEQGGNWLKKNLPPLRF
jgi:hypothetical protein